MGANSTTITVMAEPDSLSKAGPLLQPLEQRGKVVDNSGEIEEMGSDSNKYLGMTNTERCTVQSCLSSDSDEEDCGQRQLPQSKVRTTTAFTKDIQTQTLKLLRAHLKIVAKEYRDEPEDEPLENILTRKASKVAVVTGRQVVIIDQIKERISCIDGWSYKQMFSEKKPHPIVEIILLDFATFLKADDDHVCKDWKEA